ncbi:hypothetical protein L1887_47151 [Cichorium endivia]|nr:hypothetical protein L1887_47151 [Cichorium endivia]
MTNVLNQGTAFDELERLGGTRKCNRLIDLVCQEDLQLALSVCQVCPGRDVEPMSVLLLSIFDAKGGLIRFLKAAVEEEIQRTATEEMGIPQQLLLHHPALHLCPHARLRLPPLHHGAS